MLERVNMFLEKLVSEDSVVTRELAAIIYRGLSPIWNEYFEIDKKNFTSYFWAQICGIWV